MNELDRKIKDLKVMCYDKPLAMELIDILEIELKDNIQNAEEFLLVIKNLELISLWLKKNIESLKNILKY